MFESDHPYAANDSKSLTVNIPGAKFVRVVIDKYDLENRYDYIKLSTSDGVLIEKIDGKGEDVMSDFIPGGTVNIEFITDRSVQKWGFVITKLQYIAK